MFARLFRSVGGPVTLTLLVLASGGMTGCAHSAPVKSWQRGHLATKRALRFDDGLEGRFRQHLLSSREGADGGYGQPGGGCGCN